MTTDRSVHGQLIVDVYSAINPVPLRTFYSAAYMRLGYAYASSHKA